MKGAPVRALGGEGVLVEERVTQADFEFQVRFDRLAPAILVEAPRPFATAGDPVRVAGSASTFEATVNLAPRRAGHGPGIRDLRPGRLADPRGPHPGDDRRSETSRRSI